MNSNWSKILLFSLLFGVLGFVLGRMCGSCHKDACGPDGGRAECHGGAGRKDCCKDGHHAGAMGGDTISVISPITGDTARVINTPGH